MKVRGSLEFNGRVVGGYSARLGYSICAQADNDLAVDGN